MQKNSKYFLIALLGSTCFTVLLIFNLVIVPGLDPLSSSSSSDSDGIDENARGRGEPLDEVHNIDLSVDFLSQSTKSWENYSLYNGKTSVLDALEEKCTVGTEQHGIGILVVEIDGVNGNWIYKVNGVQPGVGAAVYYLSDGDEIEWVQV